MALFECNKLYYDDIVDMEPWEPDPWGVEKVVEAFSTSLEHSPPPPAEEEDKDFFRKFWEEPGVRGKVHKTSTAKNM